MAKAVRSIVYDGDQRAAISAALRYMCKRDAASDPIEVLRNWGVERIDITRSTQDRVSCSVLLRKYNGSGEHSPAIRLDVIIAEGYERVFERSRTRRKERLETSR